MAVAACLEHPWGHQAMHLCCNCDQEVNLRTVQATGHLQVKGLFVQIFPAMDDGLHVKMPSVLSCITNRRMAFPYIMSTKKHAGISDNIGFNSSDMLDSVCTMEIAWASNLAWCRTCCYC